MLVIFLGGHLLYCSIDLTNYNLQFFLINIVAAYRGMHVSPAKHSYVWLPRKRDYRTDRHTHGQTDGQTDRRRTKWSLCAAMLRRRHKNHKQIQHSTLDLFFLVDNKIGGKITSYHIVCRIWNEFSFDMVVMKWDVCFIVMHNRKNFHNRLIGKIGSCYSIDYRINR